MRNKKISLIAGYSWVILLAITSVIITVFGSNVPLFIFVSLLGTIIILFAIYLVFDWKAKQEKQETWHDIISEWSCDDERRSLVSFLVENFNTPTRK